MFLCQKHTLSRRIGTAVFADFRPLMYPQCRINMLYNLLGGPNQIGPTSFGPGNIGNTCAPRLGSSGDPEATTGPIIMHEGWFGLVCLLLFGKHTNVVQGAKITALRGHFVHAERSPMCFQCFTTKAVPVDLLCILQRCLGAVFGREWSMRLY